MVQVAAEQQQQLVWMFAIIKFVKCRHCTVRL